MNDHDYNHNKKLDDSKARVGRWWWVVDGIAMDDSFDFTEAEFVIGLVMSLPLTEAQVV